MFLSKRKNVSSKKKNVFVEETECLVEEKEYFVEEKECFYRREKNASVKEKECSVDEKECFCQREKDVFVEEKRMFSLKRKREHFNLLPKFTNDTITDYSKPSPSIKSNTSDLQNSNSSVFKHEESLSSIMSKPMIKFVKAVDSLIVIKTNKVETARKSSVKYAKMYRNTSESHKVRGYYDSGCSRHMTGNISYLFEYEPYDGGYVSFGQGGGKITGKGIIKTGKLEFENVYFVKDLKYNLFSVSQICDNKNNVLFTDSECIVLGKDFKLKDDTNVLLRTPRQNNMYSIDLNNIFPHKNLTCLVAKASADESMLWHRRLGHLNFNTMNKLVRHNLVKGLPSKCYDNDYTCVACLKGKQHKASCKTKLVNSVSKPLHTLHMDLFGPTFVSSLNHKWYCLVVTDDFSRFTWTLFLRTKNETSGILRNFITEIENLKDLKVKIIRVLVNKSQNKTPYELFNSRTPAIGFLRPFGCHVMILNTLDHLGKFDAKGDEVVVVGTSSTNISGTKEVASQGVKKDVSSLRYIALPNWFHDAHMESSNSDAQNACNADVSKSSGISNPTATSKIPAAKQMEFEDILGDRTNSVDTNGVEDDLSNMETSITASPTPTFRIHKDHPRTQIIGPVDTPIQTRHKSKEMEEHSFIATIHQKTTPDLLQFCLFLCFLSQEEPKKIFDALKDLRIRRIGMKWVLKNKKDERGIVVRNKARLVAQWHTQEEGIDYKEVFAPVSRIEAIRLFLGYASFMGFFVYHMDVKSAFLYGTIDEEVYVMQPPGFQDPKFPDRLYKVEKAMYGLHQTLFIRMHKGEFLLVQVSANTPMDKENPWEKIDLRIFRYLEGHPKLGLWYPKESPFGLVAYSDSDYGGATQDRKSTTGGLSKPRDALSKGITSFVLLFPKSTGFNEFSSNIATAVVCLATNRVYNFSKMIFDGMVRNVNSKGGSNEFSSNIATAVMAAKIQDQDLVISSLKARVKILEGKDRGNAEPSKDDALIKGRSMKIGEEVGVERSTKLGSNETEEMVNVLSSMKAANILTSGVTAVSVSPVARVLTVGVPTVSGLFPNVSAIFTTASVVTPYSRRPRGILAKDKGKEKVVESEEPKKK
nr:putative ribonuclease H-like domain-containing protein [Tanacetum cinerariifolium]